MRKEQAKKRAKEWVNKGKEREKGKKRAIEREGTKEKR